MPSSPWATTGSAGSATAATTPLGTQAGVDAVNTVVAQQNSTSYMTNLDKINFCAQWAAEANTKTSLDAQAVAAGVSSTAYDNAVSNVSTGIITAGAPSNWASIWPDGTTSGPWTNVMMTLSSLWAIVATQRAALQDSISASHAAAAQAAAISTAATDASTKMSTATTNALAQAPTLVAGLPTLPNVSYPVNKMVFDSVTNRLYTNVAGVWKASTATVPSTDITGQLADAQVAALAASKVTGQMTDSQIAAVAAAKVSGTLVDSQIASGLSAAKLIGSLSGATVPTAQLSGYLQAAQIQANSIGTNQISAGSITADRLVISNFENLVSNPNSSALMPTGLPWPSGSAESSGLGVIGGTNLNYFNPPVGGYCRIIPPGAGNIIFLTGNIPCKPGETYQASAALNSMSGGYDCFFGFIVSDAYGVGQAWPGVNVISSTPGNPTVIAYTCPATLPNGNPPAGITLYMQNNSSTYRVFGNFFQMKRMTDASLIVDGSIVASKLAAGSITAGNAAIANAAIATAAIQDGAITNAKIANLDAGKINTGYLAAGIIQAGSLDASKIAAGTITSDRMTANSITGDRIQANSLDASKITANTITAGQISAGAIGATQIAAGAITAASMTLLNQGNLIPNPTSSYTNPQGAPWPSGSWEARGLGIIGGTDQAIFNPPTNGYSRIIYGNASTETILFLCPLIPVIPGESYSLSAFIFNLNSNPCCLYVRYVDGTGVVGNWIRSPLTGYGQVSLNFTLPATCGTGKPPAYIDVYMVCPAGPGNNIMMANFFVLRRCADASLIVDGSILTQKLAANSVMTSNFATDTGQTASSLGASGIPSGNPTAGAWLGVGSTNPILVGPGGMKVGIPQYGGSYTSSRIDGPTVMAFNSLRTNYTTSSPPQYPRFWYGGNCDSGTLGGAPNINRLTLNPTVWDTTNHILWLDFLLAPSTSTDNLDSMRYATVQFYRQSAAGTTGTLTSIGPVFRVALKDRLYYNPGTDGDSGNVVGATLSAVHSSFSSGYIACIVTLYNASGPSAANCFYTPSGWSAGSSLVNNGTSFPSGLTGGGSGGGGGGGGGGTGCVPAGTLLLMADGSTLPIEQAEIGVEVAAWDDETLQPVSARIARTFVFEDRALWRIVTADGELVCSHDHRILQGAAWVPAREVVVGTPTLWRLVTGELVYSTILEAAPTGDTAAVYHVGLDRGHVYCAGNLLAHNLKILS